MDDQFAAPPSHTSEAGKSAGPPCASKKCAATTLEPSMSRKGNCWDSAVAESFFSSLKKERLHFRGRNVGAAPKHEFHDHRDEAKMATDGLQDIESA